MQPDIRTVDFDFKAASDGTVEGLCSAFYNIDSYGEIVDDEAFDQDLPAFLRDGFIGGLNHDWDHPIGKPMEAKRQAEGLYVKGRISETDHGRECRKLMQDAVVKKLSIGYPYRGTGRQNLETADECMAYWQRKNYTPNAQDMARCQYGATLLTRIKLYEFSPVTMPANDLATITAVKTEDLEGLKSLRDFEEFLRDVGRFSRREAKALLSSLKTLLRDAESEHRTVETDASAPSPDRTDDTTPDAPPDAPAIDTKAGETPAETPAPEVVAPPDVPDVRIPPPSPLALEIEVRRQQVAVDLYKRFQQIGA